MNIKIQQEDLKKYLVELLGTFVLTAIVALVVNSSLGALAPVLAAFTVGLFVYTVGHVSGAHLNPGVTIGAWSIGKIKVEQVVGYLIAQFAGASAAALLVAKGLGVVLQQAPEVIGWQAMVMVVLAEAFGMFLFTFGIAAVVYGKVAEAAKGWVVAMSLLLGILLASGFGSRGILNPAVAFGINSFIWVYVVGPVVGAIVGMWAYKFLASKE